MHLTRHCLLNCLIGLSSFANATPLGNTIRQPINAAANVSPSFLNGQPYTEFADVVTAIMGQEGSQWTYNWQPNLALVWLPAVTPPGDIARKIRMGYLRLDIAGKTTSLRQNHQELGWQLALMTESTSDNTPEWIQLQAEGCYKQGKTYCLFDPLPSLDRKGIRHHQVCAAAPDYDGGTRSYMLQFDHHEDVLMTISGDIVNEGVSHILTFSRRRADMPCGPQIEEGSQFEPDDDVYTESSPWATAPYQRAAKRIFQQITPQRSSYTQRCQIDLFVNHDGTFATAQSQFDANNVALCGRAIDALQAAHYPRNVSGKRVHLKTTITQ